MNVEVRGDRAKVSLELFDPAGDRLNFAAIRARVVPPAEPDNARNGPRDVAFLQVGPGLYEAEVDAAAVGSHLLSIRYDGGAANADDSGSRSGSVRAAIIRRAGEEFREPTPNTNLLWDLARRTNGRIYRLDPSGVDLWVRDHLRMPEISRAVWLIAALAAIGLFLVDVAARRMLIDFDRVQSRVAALFGRAPEVASASMATLAAAKARAGGTMASRSADVAGPSSPHQAEALSHADSPTFGSTTTEPTQTGPSREPADPKGSAPHDGDVMDRLRAAKKRSLPPT